MQPTDDEMRNQWYRTMLAAEDAFKSISAHLSGDTARDSKGKLGVSRETPSDLDEIKNRLDKHNKALAVIGSFVTFEKNSLGFDPAWKVHSLVGLTACRECGGSGWLARDESCKNCKRSGFLSV